MRKSLRSVSYISTSFFLLCVCVLRVCLQKKKPKECAPPVSPMTLCTQISDVSTPPNLGSTARKIQPRARTKLREVSGPRGQQLIRATQALLPQGRGDSVCVWSGWRSLFTSNMSQNHRKYVKLPSWLSVTAHKLRLPHVKR